MFERVRHTLLLLREASCFIPYVRTNSCLWHHCGRAMFATTGALAPQRSALKRSARLKDVALQLLNKSQNDCCARVPGVFAPF